MRYYTVRTRMIRAQHQFDRSIFIDSSNIDEIREWHETGVIDGATTNQLIMLKDGVKPGQYERVIKTICKELKGMPVSVELTDSTATPESMVREAKRINAIATNIVVKVPMIPDTTKSLWVIQQLAKSNIAVNVTTMMTYEQMVMATLVTRHCKKPSFISIFWGRSLEDQAKYRSRSDYMAKYPRVGTASEVNAHPRHIVQNTRSFLDEGGYDNVHIIAGSIRTSAMVGEAFAAGAHIVTITPDTLIAMLFSQRSIETIKQFDEAWKELQKSKR